MLVVAERAERVDGSVGEDILSAGWNKKKERDVEGIMKVAGSGTVAGGRNSNQSAIGMPPEKLPLKLE